MKVLVIGTGFGGGVVAPIYRSLGCEVEVVSPRDEEAVRAACASTVDLVSIHSPPFLHRQHATWAIEAGHAVLCDKPFGLNPQEAEAMRDLAVSAGVLHFLNFEFREHPCRKMLKTLLSQGEIGELEHVTWTFIGAAMRSRDYDWRADSALGGGWIGAYGSHAIDLLRWLFESEVEDCGGLIHYGIPYRKDRTGAPRASTSEVGYSAWFKMANGRAATMDTDYAASVFLPQRITLLGSEGALELVDDVEVVVRRPGQSPRTLTFERSLIDPHEPGLTPWLTRVCDAVRDNQAISPNFDDGVAVAHTMQRLRTGLQPIGAPRPDVSDTAPESRTPEAV